MFNKLGRKKIAGTSWNFPEYMDSSKNTTKELRACRKPAARCTHKRLEFWTPRGANSVAHANSILRWLQKTEMNRRDEEEKGLLWKLPPVRSKQLGKLGPAFGVGAGCGFGFAIGLIGGVHPTFILCLILIERITCYSTNILAHGWVLFSFSWLRHRLWSRNPRFTAWIWTWSWMWGWFGFRVWCRKRDCIWWESQIY